MRYAALAFLPLMLAASGSEARPPFCAPGKPCPVTYAPGGVATDASGVTGALFYAKDWQQAIVCYNGYAALQPVCSPAFSVDPSTDPNAYLDNYQPMGLTMSKSVPVAWFFSAPTGLMVSCKWQNAAVSPVCSAPMKMGDGSKAR